MSIDKVLITGSCGLVGSEATRYFADLGCDVVGIDNNLRKEWFGKEGDTSEVKKQLKELTNYRHITLDITDEHNIREIVKEEQPDLIIHAAAQPSHEKSAEIPLSDFKVNAFGTINLLEAVRLHSPNTIFVFVSTNKVYGDLRKRNMGPLSMLTQYKEDEKRMLFQELYVPVGRKGFWKTSKGMRECWSLDQSVHSPFGASKAAADLMVQEYGQYYGIKTVCFRCGCITGRAHKGVEQHGFLSYLCKCAKEGKEYTIYGYKGKQVRDNIHAYDLVRAIHEYSNNPSFHFVYNMGGGLENSCSVIEAIEIIKDKIGIEVKTKEGPKRKGDHEVYYTDCSRFQKDYPNWKITRDLDSIFDELLR